MGEGAGVMIACGERAVLIIIFSSVFCSQFFGDFSLAIGASSSSGNNV